MTRHYEDEKIQSSEYRVIRWFGFDQFVPERAVTSYWISSKAFFIVRFILTLYSTVVFWCYLGGTAAYLKFSQFFTLFTTMTFIGLHAYLVTSTVHHFRYLRNKNVNFLLQQPAVLNYLYMYLYSTIITFNILTPVIFWSVLAKYVGQFSPAFVWLNTSVHGVSFFLMFIDVILSRMKVPIRLIIFVLFTIILYMLLSFIIFGSTGIWVYPFLDWDQGPKTAIWYFGIAVFVVIAFFFMVLVHLLRDWIARKTNRISPDTDEEKTQQTDGAHQEEPILRVRTRTMDLWRDQESGKIETSRLIHQNLPTSSYIP